VNLLARVTISCSCGAWFSRVIATLDQDAFDRFMAEHGDHCHCGSPREAHAAHVGISEAAS